jgi:hypothetical protein
MSGVSARATAWLPGKTGSVMTIVPAINAKALKLNIV